jgi:hypothetical protein
VVCQGARPWSPLASAAMVDPRIYRAGWLIVFVALVVFGFSLENRPAGATTQLAPDGSFASADASAASLADRFGAVSPGSQADGQMADALAGELRGAGGFSVSTRTAATRTAQGERAIETVEAERPGLGQGTVVVLANRDAATPSAAKPSTGVANGARTDAGPAVASTAASAVLVDLAKAMSGATLNRSVMLVSTSGSVGAAGATQFLRSLGAEDVDAVIVLGDLAGARVSQPVVTPWSGTSRLAPPILVATLNRFVHSQVGVRSGYPSLGSELAQLAFPFTTGSQAPFGPAGIPAVGLSLAGDRTAKEGATIDAARLPRMGIAVAQAVSALDAGVTVPAPGAYLTISSQLIPLWAFRLLVLGLIAPVAITLIDALARARRRGHSILSWIVWVLASIVPFIVGFAIIKLAGLSHAVSAPSGAVAVGVSFSAAGAGVIAVALLAVAVAFGLLRPVGVQVASGIGWRRTPTSPVIEGAVVALSIVLCALSLVIWIFNPFAAALLIPALHLWMWLGSPGVVFSRLRILVLVVLGLVLPALIAVYYMLALGLAPWDFAWSLTLAVAGGAVSLGTSLSWCVALGVLAGAVVLVTRASAGAAAAAAAPITVRGPTGYAGPGSLGGTESALRR